jgi:polyisoprenoid-binding protein YceI
VRRVLAVLSLSFLSAASPLWAEPKIYVVVPAKSQVMFEAGFPLGDFTGITQEVWGEFQADLENIPAGIKGSVTVNPASLKTGIHGRDRDLKKTLEVEKHPEIRFTVREVRASFPSLAERADTRLTIGGELSIRGVERPITLTGRAQIRDGQVWVRGEGNLKMTDYGIRLPKKFFLSVGDQTRVSFDVLLAPKE